VTCCHHCGLKYRFVRRGNATYSGELLLACAVRRHPRIIIKGRFINPIRGRFMFRVWRGKLTEDAAPTKVAYKTLYAALAEF